MTALRPAGGHANDGNQENSCSIEVEDGCWHVLRNSEKVIIKRCFLVA